MKTAIATFMLVLLAASLADATQVLPKELAELVAEADHVIVGKVVMVEMIDNDGKPLTSRDARTGLGHDNELRLHVEVVENGILRTSADKPIKQLVVPLWRAWHYTLGQWKDQAEGKSFIFLLKGEHFERVYPALFLRPMSDRVEVERLLEQPRAANAAQVPLNPEPGVYEIGEFRYLFTIIATNAGRTVAVGSLFRSGLPVGGDEFHRLDLPIGSFIWHPPAGDSERIGWQRINPELKHARWQMVEIEPHADPAAEVLRTLVRDGEGSGR